ncbi:MAG: hypothetical protein GY696_34950 [Gammaproteobacteria bacterium]|nr:hypothetical protein [Gammaproteobacteria bacterium]
MPQGSVIGPSLFLAFIDGLTGLIHSLTMQCFLCFHADDLLLLKPISCAKDEAAYKLIYVRLAITSGLTV